MELILLIFIYVVIAVLYSGFTLGYFKNTLGTLERGDYLFALFWSILWPVTVPIDLIFFRYTLTKGWCLR